MVETRKAVLVDPWNRFTAYVGGAVPLVCMDVTIQLH